MKKIKALVVGDGSPVILVHGWAASHRDWAEQIPALVSAGYRVYAPDQFGHGESEKPAAADHYTLPHAYAAFCTWVDNLRLNEPFSLAGHSMGGYISLLYAAEHPEQVRALVLIDPLFTPEQMTFSLKFLFSHPKLLAALVRIAPARIIAALYRFTPHRQLSLATRLQIARGYKHASPLISHMLHQFASIETYLSQVTAPSLLLYGEEDLSLKPALFSRLASRLPNLVAQHSFAHTGHTPHIDRPEEINRELLDFLAKYEIAGTQNH